MSGAFRTNPRNPFDTVNYCSQCTCEDCQSMNVFGHCSKCACCTGKFELQDNNDWNKDEEAGEKRKDLSSKGSDAYESPRKRVRTISVATSARRAVNDITCGDLSLITLQSKAEACLELCHVMPRSLDDESLTQLEYVWGMKYRSLYLDSRYNMLNLTSGLHDSFDSNHWAFIPLDMKLIARLSKWSSSKTKGPIEVGATFYKNCKDDQVFQSFYNKQKQELFNYAFLPLYDMDACIARRNQARLQEPPSKTDLPQDHYFPYATLPLLKSHIRPHFVIVNLMHKVRAFEEKIKKPITECEELSDFFKEHQDYEVLLGSCEVLFSAWMEKIVPDHFRRNNPGSLVSSGGGEGNGKAGDAGARDGGDGRDKNGARRRSSRSHTSASRSGNNNVGNAHHGQHRPEVAFPVSAPEDPAEIWDCDEVGLRPIDSVTYTSDHGEGGRDDDDDSIVIEESDSAFQERLSRWVTSIDPGLISPHDEFMSADDEWNGLLFDGTKHDLDGSPTMVGSLLLQFDDHKNSVAPSLIASRSLGKAGQIISQPTPIDSKPIDAMSLDLALVSV